MTLCMLCGGLFFVGIVTTLSSSEVCKEAVTIAQNSPEVQDALGTPIDKGFLVQGEINLSIGTGYANLTIPLHGSDDSGTLYVEAVKEGGDWHFYTLALVTSSDNVIDLIGDE